MLYSSITLFCRVKKFLLVIFIFMQLPTAALASYDDQPIRMPSDFSRVDIYLVTVDVADTFYLRGGHSMLRVVDNLNRFDVVFNWGIFNFRDPAFLYNFFKGVLNYRLAIWDTAATFDYYREDEKRGVWQDKLDLTIAQKTRLLEQLVWWSDPKHRVYSYSIWFENCATRIRDLLDYALGGNVKEHFSKTTDRSYRDFTRENLKSAPPIDLFLELMLNSNVDRHTTLWDQMYLPYRLREVMLQMPVVNEAGVLESNRRFLTSSTRLFDGKVSTEAAVSGYMWFFVLFFLPILAGFLFISPQCRRVTSKRLQQLSKRVFGVGLIGWSICAAVLASAMILTWLFSEHSELHHNANLWLVWPLDILFVAGAFGFLREQSDTMSFQRQPPWLRRATITLACLHLVAGIGLAAGYFAEMFSQDLSRSLGVILPIALGYNSIYLLEVRTQLRRAADLINLKDFEGSRTNKNDLGKAGQASKKIRRSGHDNIPKAS
jgi:hypothetical protein